MLCKCKRWTCSTRYDQGWLQSCFYNHILIYMGFGAQWIHVQLRKHYIRLVTIRKVSTLSDNNPPPPVLGYLQQFFSSSPALPGQSGDVSQTQAFGIQFPELHLNSSSGMHVLCSQPIKPQSFTVECIALHNTSVSAAVYHRANCHCAVNIPPIVSNFFSGNNTWMLQFKWMRLVTVPAWKKHLTSRSYPPKSHPNTWNAKPLCVDINKGDVMSSTKSRLTRPFLPLNRLIAP